MRQAFALAIVLGLATVSRAQLPPPPVPIENPITEPKRVLGKILFWDEQLSSANEVACGTCHQPKHGGADGRIGVHPGPSASSTADDILGSPGVPRINESGIPVDDPLFGFDVQVTRRAANTILVAAYAPEVFWDGRSGEVFIDPETGATSIPAGGALESQAIRPLLSPVEMAHEGRTWEDVRFKLERTLPLRDATDLPPDVAAALAGGADYPALFEAAFGAPTIDAERIAQAIATYERTLVPDETPWDRFIAGDDAALTNSQKLGWSTFNAFPCVTCHTPPAFTSHTFRNLGLRPLAEDLGRQQVTGSPFDGGRFKVPTLRNVGLKNTLMHNGRLESVLEAVLWYRADNPERFPDNLDPAVGFNVPEVFMPGLVDFVTNGLTDPRVAAETFPFDRPTLHGGDLAQLDFRTAIKLIWPALAGAQGYRIYRGSLDQLGDLDEDGLPDVGYGACMSDLDPNPADTSFTDSEIPPVGSGFFYLKTVIDNNGAERGLGATSEGLPRTVAVPCP